MRLMGLEFAQLTTGHPDPQELFAFGEAWIEAQRQVHRTLRAVQDANAEGLRLFHGTSALATNEENPQVGKITEIRGGDRRSLSEIRPEMRSRRRSYGLRQLVGLQTSTFTEARHPDDVQFAEGRRGMDLFEGHLTVRFHMKQVADDFVRTNETPGLAERTKHRKREVS